MKADINEVCILQSDIVKLQEQLKNKEARLDSVRRSCDHVWNDIIYDPIHTPGYHIPADDFGGVDRRGAMDVPSETRRRWKRTCKHCNISQYTDRTKKIQISGHIAGTTAETEVPDFPDVRKAWQ